MQSGYRSQRHKQRLMSEINVVPYIDVTLVLLIIFMVTAPIVQQAVSVDLPKTPVVESASTQAVENDPFVISITQDGLYKTSKAQDVFISDKELENLVAEVIARSKLNAKQEFYIQGDKHAEYGKVLQLFTILKSNGVENVSLMTEPMEPAGASSRNVGDAR